MKKFVVLFFLITLSVLGYAQFYNGSQMNFGKNRVQHQNFFWQYYRTTTYDVYFYPNSQPLAQYTYLKADAVILEMINKLKYNPIKKFQFFVYTTKSDFLESNFGFDNENFYNQGGIANIYGSKIYLYFDGNHNNFDRMIRAGIAQIFALQMVEGPSASANISSDYMMSVPDWFYPGLASYIAEPWNSELETHVRNGVLTHKYTKIEELSPTEAIYAGHSFFKFIADRYGDQALTQILLSARNVRSVERAFELATEIKFSQLMVDWYRYYFVLFKKEDKANENVLGEGALKRPKPRRIYQQLNLSPIDDSYTFVTNESGQIKVWLQHQDETKPKVIFRKHQKTEDNPDLTFPIVAWHPTARWIGVTIEDKGRCYYYPYDVKEGKWDKRRLIDVEKITDWSYSDDGKTILFSGYKNGQSDIFLYSLQARSYKNLTNDFYDDYAPRFINNQRDIVFSSNRPHDTLKTDARFYNTINQKYYDLFVYHYENKDPHLLRVTNTPAADETHAMQVAPHQIIYLSNLNGTNNRYIAKFDSVITKIDTAIHYAYFAKNYPQTHYQNSIFDHDYSKNNNIIGIINKNDGVERIYLTAFENTNIPTLPLTTLKQAMLDVELEKDSIEQAKIASGDTIPLKKRGFHQVRQSDIRKQKQQKKQSSTQIQDSSSTQNTDQEEIPPFTEDYEFSSLVPRNYDVQFNVNKLATQLDVNFLNTSYQQFTGGPSPIYLNMGLNALFMVGITDLFENHRITGGFRPSLDFSGMEFMLSYENLKKRLDKQVVIHRQTIKQMQGNNIYKQKSNNLYLNLSYPFNKFNAMGLNLGLRYETLIVGAMSEPTLSEKSTHAFWGSAKLSYTFDSSKELFTNLWHGTKAKFFVEYQQKIAKKSMNLLVLGFDIRKSVRVYKNIVWANRLAASTNIGSGRLVYYLGGVDSWMFAKFDSDIYVDESKDYHYQTLATSMRGFSQNIRNGTSFMVFSSELRVPIAQIIAGGKVRNNFLNSMQTIAFVDVGTAWTGLTPYSDDNALYIRKITAGPVNDPYITATVKRQVEPWVAGIGLGLRASLFGYFLRLDYAWGFEDFRPYQKDKNGMLHFSFGLDF